uniref:Reverse transcriptase domain-containing protein n=1 Tax=Nothobranchius furzeri TaxID=105023 RepID=A0A8C6LAW8_NOTFU
MITAVYIPPDANVSLALDHLYYKISEQQQTYPEGVHIIAGDFNKACLRTVLSKFVQHVKCPTRGNNILDHVYTNIKQAYKSVSLPPLGKSDHLSLLLLPAYIPLKKRTRPIIKTINTLTEGAIAQLQDCFAHTEWSIFENEDLQIYTDAVLCYIKHCMDTVIIHKQVRIYPNCKPWMTSKVRVLLKARNAAYASGDQAKYWRARTDLKKGMKEAKMSYTKKLSQHLSASNPRRVWEGLRHITKYKDSRSRTEIGASLAEKLNYFFARFENTSFPTTNITPITSPAEFGSDTQILTLQEQQVRTVFRAVHQRKAAGPDGIPGKVLKNCAEQLSMVFTKLFNRSLSEATVPYCLKSTTIAPLPKSTTINSLNDYRPIALTPVVTKCFEKLVQKHIKDFLPPSMDPCQFLYKANKSTEDAISNALHSSLQHLENPGTSVRMLFIDFSSAFNTIIPNIFVAKLINLNLPPTTCGWIKDFLTICPQAVRFGDKRSSTLMLSTGSPQGCVLSPLLFTIYTHDCIPIPRSNKIIKFADDTTLVGLIHNNDDAAYRDEVCHLSEWCDDHNLSLNIKKTKMVIDFRRSRNAPSPLCIKGAEVERVPSFKFLGIYISEDLSWTINTTALVKKAQQRLYFLRVLKWNRLQTNLLVSFYRAVIESVMTYAIPVWYAGCTVADKNRYQRVIRAAEKVIGCTLPSLDTIALQRCLTRARTISRDIYHPNHYLFAMLPSGKRFRSLSCRTDRLRKSFFPWAIRTLNGQKNQPY